MATLRYKKHPDEPFHASQFNTSAASPIEILTGDDSAFARDLDVLINGEWKDLLEAFQDHDLIVDNFNTFFFVPNTPEDRERGFAL